VCVIALREALTRLAVQGFVTNESRRGFRVAPMSKEDLEEITRIRLMIEIDAFGRSMEFGDTEWEMGIVSSFARLKVVAQRHGISDFANPGLSRAHKEFHQALIAACRSPRLIELQGILYEQAQRYRQLTFKNMHDVNHFIDRHQPLVDVALARNLTEGEAVLSAHLRLIKDSIYPTRSKREENVKKPKPRTADDRRRQ
jgi:GntR family carbon starvation induced transcriptional regulator